MLNQKLVDFWGVNLRQVTILPMLTSLLTEATTTFLSSVGLPTTESIESEKRAFLASSIRPQLRYMINSQMIKIFPYFQFVNVLDKQVEFGGKLFVPIGYQPNQYGAPSTIALKVASDELYLIDNQNSPDRSSSGISESMSLLNSGCYELLRCLMEVLTLYRALAKLRNQYNEAISSITPTTVEADDLYQTMENHVAVTENILMHIDLRAMQESSNAWVGLINDMRSFGP